MIPAGDDMKYKLIVSDLDGTLLNGQKFVSNINKEAIRKAKEQGMSFAIASGRPLYPILSLIKQWEMEELVDYVLGMNGGCIYDKAKDAQKNFYTIDGELLKHIMDQYRDMPVRFWIFEKEKRYVNKGTEATRAKAALYHEDEQITDLYALCNQPRQKLIVECRPEDMDMVEQRARKLNLSTCAAFRSDPTLFEFVDKRVNKTSGLRHLCADIGITMDEVLAFGDTSNDNEMLKEVGHGVWMSNGTMDTFAHADAQTISNEEDGVAWYLEKHILAR